MCFIYSCIFSFSPFLSSADAVWLGRDPQADLVDMASVPAEEAGFDWGLLVGSGVASAFVVGAASLLFRCVRYKGECVFFFSFRLFVFWHYFLLFPRSFLSFYLN